MGARKERKKGNPGNDGGEHMAMGGDGVRDPSREGDVVRSHDELTTDPSQERQDLLETQYPASND